MPPKSLLEAVSAYLRHDGLESGTQVLDSSVAEIVQTEFDNWNGGTYYYCFQIHVSSTAFISLGEGVKFLEDRICDNLNSFAHVYPNHLINKVSITPTLTNASNGSLDQHTRPSSNMNLPRLFELAEQIQSFRFCSPSADPEEQTTVVYGFKSLVKRFVTLANRVPNREFRSIVSRLDVNIDDDIYRAYNLSADAQAAIEYLYEIDSSGDSLVGTFIEQTFIDHKIIEQLRDLRSNKLDFSKVIRMCEEINSSYEVGNYISTALLIRALINHVPPIFGRTTFAQVVSQSSRSIKELIAPLDDTSRKVADLHTHTQIRSKESLPTRNQLEPFKANLEILLVEIIAQISERDS